MKIFKFLITLLFIISSFSGVSLAKKDCSKYEKGSSKYLKCAAEKSSSKVKKIFDSINEKKTLFDLFKKSE